jgi:DNA polymerase delta subunit 4
MDDIEVILRVFDANEEFGPCSRMTCVAGAIAFARNQHTDDHLDSRLERWERAEKLGLKPDPEVS